MTYFSRRQLAAYAVDQLAAGAKPKKIGEELVAALSMSKKLKEADLLLQDINQELERRGILTNATVTSAHPLSSQAREALVKRVKSLTGSKHVAVNQQIDPKVLGGLRIETANHSWDQTVMRKLSDIKGGI